MIEMVPASIPDERLSKGIQTTTSGSLLLSEDTSSVDPARASGKKVCFAAVVNRELTRNRENSYHGGSVSSIELLGPSFCTIFLATLGTFKSLNSLKKLGAESDTIQRCYNTWLPCRLYHPPISFNFFVVSRDHLDLVHLFGANSPVPTYCHPHHHRQHPPHPLRASL
jgi:hypothetical protein